MQDRQREILLRALNDDDAKVRQAASAALEHLEAAADVSVLQRVVQGSDRRQRVAAVYTLERIKTPETGAILRELLQDQDPDVRAVAVQAVGTRQDKSALAALVRCLKDSSPAVAVHAARALAHFKDKRLVPYLQAMCSSDNTELVCTCLDTLGEIGDLSGVAAGVDAAAHPSAEVRLSAVRMLGRLH